MIYCYAKTVSGRVGLLIWHKFSIGYQALVKVWCYRVRITVYTLGPGILVVDVLSVEAFYRRPAGARV